MKGNEESINAIANGSCGDVHKKNYISLHRIFNLVGGKTMEEYKREIEDIVELLGKMKEQDERFLKKLYTIILSHLKSTTR